MLNPTHLNTLREVLAAGSFAEAATRLGYTPSAVSQQIAALERSTGLRLFERDARSIQPTQAAALVARRAVSILGSLDALEREVHALASTDRGVIRLGSFPTASAGLLPDALARLRQTRPHVTVQLDEGEPDEIVPMLAAGALDLALVYQYETVPRRWPPTVRQVTLMTEDLFVLAPATLGLPPGGYVPMDALQDATWIATREGTAGERCLLRLCATHGYTPRVAYRSNDFDVVRGLVRTGLGVALVPALAVVEHPGVRRLVPRDHAPKRHVLALTRTSDVAPLVEPVLASLTESVRQLAATSP